MFKLLPSLWLGYAMALPPDEVESPELIPAYEDAPVALPASTADAPCGEDDQMEVDVEVAVSSSGPFLTFPVTAGVTGWRVQATSYYGPHRTRWTQ
jgi:hypothetical protein